MTGLTNAGLTQIFRSPSGLVRGSTVPCLGSQEASVLGKVGVLAAKEAIFLAKCEKGEGGAGGRGPRSPLGGACSWKSW